MSKIDNTEITHDYCIGRAARTLAALYKQGVSQETHDRSLEVVDRWIAIAKELRSQSVVEEAKFEAIKAGLEDEMAEQTEDELGKV